MLKARGLVVAGLIVCGSVGGVFAQQISDIAIDLPLGTANSAPAEVRGARATTAALAKLVPQARWKEMVVCGADRPSSVQRYNVTCTGATTLDAQIADCCVPGDHWEAKVKSWDSAPNTSVTTAPGPANVFSLLGRVYNYGGTPQSPGRINAEVDCSYLHGTNLFPAAAYIALSSDGTCTVTDLGSRDSINRTP